MTFQEKTVVLITGANSGIGFETVRALLQSSRAYHAYFGSRSAEKGNMALIELKKEFPDSASVLELAQIDVARDESIAAACEMIENGPGYLDVLINNAGK